MWLFALFIAVPLIEIALFIEIGGWLTLWPTLGIVVATAAIGAWLARQQGYRTLHELQRSLDELRDPATPLAHGAMILFAGALLLTPGFMTDTVGFALLIPPVRTALLQALIRHGKVRAARTQHHHRGPAGPADPHRRGGSASSEVIEGEFEETEPPRRPTHGGSSGWTRH